MMELIKDFAEEYEIQSVHDAITKFTICGIVSVISLFVIAFIIIMLG